jgi:hypothetical protein
MRSSPNFWRVSRKGPAVKATVRLPKVLPLGQSTDALQQELDGAVEDGDDLVFQVHLGTKATVFLVAVIIQLLYVFHDAFLQAYGLTDGSSW